MRIALALILIALASTLSARTINTGPYFLSFEPNTSTLTKESATAAALIKDSLSLMEGHSVYICSLTATGRLADARVWEVGEALVEAGVDSEKIWPDGECPPDISGRKGDQIPAETVFVLQGLDETLEAAIEAAQANQVDYIPDEGWTDEWDVSFYERWFGNQLAAMQEPSFRDETHLAGFMTRYRLLILPSFAPASAVRLDFSSPDRVEVWATYLDGRGGYSPGSIAAQLNRTLSPEEVRAVGSAMVDADIERLPMMEPAAQPVVDENGEKGVVICGDGTQIVFERLDVQGHKLIERSFCARKDFGLIQLINTILSLAPKPAPAS